MTIAGEMETVSPQILKAVKELLGGCEMEFLPHAVFKEKTRTSQAVVRTGEFTPYANIILEAGVIF